MATKKVSKPVDVEKIFVHVTCPVCEGQVTMKMRGPVTRKSCPKCNHITYVFTITPLRGYIQVEAITIGSDETPRDYDIGAEDVTLEDDEEV